jgi:hypothetical protein
MAMTKDEAFELGRQRFLALTYQTRLLRFEEMFSGFNDLTSEQRRAFLEGLYRGQRDYIGSLPGVAQFKQELGALCLKYGVTISSECDEAVGRINDPHNDDHQWEFRVHVDSNGVVY